jgi:hypothetical protein
MCGSEGVRCGASGAIGPALVPKLVGETRAEAAVHQLTALPEPPAETFRDWWRRERGEGGAQEPARPRYLDWGPRWRRIQIASKNGAERTGGDARHTILSAIRSALADRSAPADVPRGYRRRSERSRAESVTLFADRVGEYRATVRRAAAGELGDALAVLCREAGARTLAVPRDPPDTWRLPGVELVPDSGLTPHELDELDGALTGCALGIAETGTIVLDGGPGAARLPRPGAG